MDINEQYIYEDEVRDNETDLQGIVNNSNYFIYMAHTRHKHIKNLGLDFADLHNKGYNLVVSEANIKYKSPLTAGDKYLVTCKLKPAGKIRLIFEQEVIRKSDNRKCALGTITATCLSTATGRPKFPDEIIELLNM
ncbi:MAG TPA: thioesterase family protein [Victivallales bacterium]|nr:thioesterase family protein [Victivallales bacterium]